MGRSKSSCFNIIPCARGDPAVDDPVAVASPEVCLNKVSSDKRRWSFRKRSSGHQAPTGTVISEALCVSYNKETPDVTANTFHSPKSLSVLEKAPQKDTLNEMPLVSSVLDKSEFIDPSATDENSNVIDHDIEVTDVVIIQASIRGHLVRREYHKVKNAIKLQAAVRGHLVRRQAVVTLRCVQAIIKVQALTRARRAHMLSAKLDEQEVEKFQKDKQSPATLGKRNPGMESDNKYDSSKSLLSNGFARQLLESAPKMKPIYINCDPAKSDSSWKWLERWMALILPEGQPERSNFQGCQEQEENSKPMDYHVGNDAKLAEPSVSSDSNLAPCESIVPTEDEMQLVTKSSGVSGVHDLMPNPEKGFTSLVKDDKDQSRCKDQAIYLELEKEVEVKAQVEKSGSALSHMTLQTDTSELLHNSVSDKPGSDSNLEQYNMKALSEPLDTEGHEFVSGSKPYNPVLSTLQPKFEELISTSTACMTTNSLQDGMLDSSLDNTHHHVDHSHNTEVLILAENTLSHDPRVQVAASECGTEISISSTLDSPDRSEAAGGEIVLEVSMEKQKYHANGGSPVSVNPGTTEAKIISFPEKVLPPDRLEEGDRNLASSNSQQIDMSSLDGTPRSHTILADLHGTPASQSSVSAKKNKKESRRVDGQLISQIGKRSPSNLTNDSGEKHQQKDYKNAKRRNSMGTDRPDHVDQEPARISSSNSLPSYMQATESARAKAHASVSPKSSPDLHNKDNYTKKRHSLPIANGQQGSSPRMGRSTSQTRQSSKGNAIHSPLSSAERKWQR